ncbi:hypothetical protein GW796_07620 [archaeon]|nr:hypothetical protein [archaeon]
MKFKTKQEIEVWLNKSKIIGGFNCGDNQLTSLKYCPQKIDGHFNCSYNKLNTLYYIPEEVNEIIFLNDNPLLWKYQPIKTYEELVMENDLYTLKDRLNVNLGVNTKTIKI